MTDEREDEGLVDPDAGGPPPPEPEGDEDMGDFDLGDAGGEIDTAALLAEAEEDQLRARAGWHLLPKAVFVFAFANCLFFAGALAAWTRQAPEAWRNTWNAEMTTKYANDLETLATKLEPSGPVDPSEFLTGLDTIRGTLIFALALYGFLQLFFSIHGRTIRIWPYMVNALLALEVGISGITSARDGRVWEMAGTYLEKAEHKTMFDDMFLQWTAVPPAYWALTAGGVLVLIVALQSIMQGAQKAKATAAEEAEGRRRRR